MKHKLEVNFAIIEKAPGEHFIPHTKNKDAELEAMKHKLEEEMP